MANQQAFTDALNAFTAAIANFNNAPDVAAITAAVTAALPAAGKTATTASAPPLRNLFKHDNAFDMLTKTGISAASQASSALPGDSWDGSPASFPQLLNALYDSFKKFNYDSPVSGIRTMTVLKPDGTPSQDPAGNDITLDVLTDFHSVTEAMVEYAYNNRTNERAIQNSEFLYYSLKESITGEIKTTIFDTPGAGPSNIDGIALLILLTQTTTLSSLQLSIQATKDLMDYDPSKVKFCIVTINKDVQHLFVLMTTKSRILGDLEKIQHILTIYAKIKQPPEWVTWVSCQNNNFTEGQLGNFRSLLNSAVIRYNKIRGENSGDFSGSLATPYEDIVALTASLQAAKKRKPSTSPRDNENTESAANKSNRPPFLRHFKSSTSADATEYKISSKDWK